MTTRFCVMLVTLWLSSVAMGQSMYQQSGGVRLGHTAGLTFKKFMIEEEALEILVSGRRDGLQLTTIYTFHKPMEFSFNENFFLYYGVGAHVGYERYDRFSKTLISVEPPAFEFRDRTFFVMGADAILGIEYRWLSVPITVAFDLKPYFTFIGMRYTNGRFWDSAISFKYIF